MELPYIPVTSPESQMDIVADFCRAWAAPIIKGNEKTPVSEFAALKIAATTHPIDVYLVDSG